jgi:lipopolysaccharide/colanic/teichoic acid biosynthesis glycosyltransferase
MFPMLKLGLDRVTPVQFGRRKRSTRKEGDVMALQDDSSIGSNSRVRVLADVMPPLGPGGRTKRVFDIVVATACLMLLFPIMLVVSIAIKLESRGPIFLRKTFYGYKNRAIEVFGFRSVKAYAETNKINSDETRVGRVLLRTGIDELPQLFNVIRGEMSIVGPRPYAGRQDLFEHRHMPMLDRVKPGLTSLAQTPKAPRGPRINADLYYVKNWSLLLDIKIILMTLASR